MNENQVLKKKEKKTKYGEVRKHSSRVLNETQILLLYLFQKY